LGVFAFAGGQDYSVTLTDDANGTVVADAVYIVKAEDLTDAVTWVPALPSSGTYQVYAKWTADETRATDARYSIVHEGGTAEVSVNQRAAGGLWHYLGSYTFDPLSTPTVTLAANDNGSVAADAVRFVGGPGGATDIAYLHADHLGTPQAITDANAQVLWWRDQTPFGQTVAEGGFSVSPLRFPGQYADTESGLAYNYFRDYDPALGRYIQSDPIGLNGGLNTYGYVKGNPLSAFDLLGLDAIFVHYVGYPVEVPGGLSVPLGHSGAIAVDPQSGETRYYEFGRYGGKCGNVRGPFNVGKIDFDQNGNPTRDSIKAALDKASRAYGKDSPTYHEYSRKSFDDVIEYAERRKHEAESCERPYNFVFDNCNNFGREATGR